jgi:hypothetical protein
MATGHTSTVIKVLQRRSPHPDLPPSSYTWWWEVHRAKYKCGENGSYTEERARALCEARIARFKERDAINTLTQQGSSLAGPAHYRYDYKIVKETNINITQELEVFETSLEQ